MAGKCSRLAGALFFDAILDVLRRMDDWACDGPEKFTDVGFDLYTYITTNIWFIIGCLREFCLIGNLNFMREHYDL